MLLRHLKTLVTSLGLMSLALVASDANAMAGSCCRTCSKSCPPEAPSPKPMQECEGDCCSTCCRKCCPIRKPQPRPPKKVDCRCLRDYDGNELYLEYDDAWHPTRNINEYNPDEWESIMLHMRVLGPLPGGQIAKMIEFLRRQ